MQETPVEAAVRAIKSGDRVFVHGANAHPQTLINALTARAPELHSVEMVSPAHEW